LPAILFLIIRDPVQILAAGGIISATHMPFVVFLTLFLNRRRLPKPYRPGLFWFVIMVIVGLYYSYFAGYFFYDLLGLSNS
jgi:Mn2+/Fe2+ NRAMP family transporter